MGGYGSGRWCRFNSYPTTDGVKSIDVRLLHRWKCLPDSWTSYGPQYGSLSWSRGDETTGSVNYQVNHDSIVLSFRYRRGDEQWRDVEQFIPFDVTPCFGGDRYWFSCPGCDRRVAVLYGAAVRFLCRHCYSIRYSSQNEIRTDRAMRKARRIRRRLGASASLFEPVWIKPTGMHWKTFERLRAQERKYSSLSLDWLIKAEASLRKSNEGKRSKRIR